jgi:type IX secretion system PorP/SprF family membrane protein
MKLIVSILTCTFLSFGILGQDLEFSQFYANPVYLNPAFAGTNGCPRFGLNYRNQWPSLKGSFVSYAAGYDQFFKGIQGGFGVLLVNDVQANTITTTSGSLIYSYHLKINRKWSALFGAKGTYQQKNLDWGQLTFGDMIDPRRGFIYQTGDQVRGGKVGFLDVSSGFVVYNKVFNFGVAANHLSEPNESMIVGESKLPMRLTAHTSAYIQLGSKSKYNNVTAIMPSVIYTYQNGFSQLNVGTYLKYGVFTSGVWFRSKDAFILSLGVQTMRYRIGYSYDITVSKLNNGASGGSHELSFGLYLNCKKKPVKFRTISCPAF